MGWRFLLSQEEHDLYAFDIESYIRNTNVFLLISFMRQSLLLNLQVKKQNSIML